MCDSWLFCDCSRVIFHGGKASEMVRNEYAYHFQRELSLQESEFKKLFDEKEEESRLAREEHELRLNSLSAAEGNKAQLMQELEAKIVAANAAKQGRDSRIILGSQRQI